MTVKELINTLENIEDKDLEVKGVFDTYIELSDGTIDKVQEISTKSEHIVGISFSIPE